MNRNDLEQLFTFRVGAPDAFSDFIGKDIVDHFVDCVLNCEGDMEQIANVFKEFYLSLDDVLVSVFD